MTAERVRAQKRRIHHHDHAAHADARPPIEEEGGHGVPPQNDEKDQRAVEGVAVEVLKDPQPALAPVPRRPTHGARRRREKERLVVGAAVVIAGEAADGREERRGADLEGEPFIAFEPDIPTRKTIDRMLRTHRVAVDTVMEFDNVETIKRSVEVGTGVSILPATTVTREAKGRMLSAAAQAFVRLLAGAHQAR